MGGDLLYSGTVAGAREACLLGVPSIAISQYMRRDVERDWFVSAIRAKFVFENILNRDRSASGFWNVNLPALANPYIEQPFPISDCEPEIQPLSFSFDAEPFDGKNAIEMMENDEPRIIQTVRYKSNYQARPRTSGSDVELCFGGHATVSWLKSNPVADRI